MIPKIANFFWNNETPLSYLRYLTLATFRYHHPDWNMIIWTADSDTRQRYTKEKQDYQDTSIRYDYLDDIWKLDIETKNYKNKWVGKLAANYISDLVRWQMIDFKGGWFFDLDQIFVRPFDDLCHYNFVGAEIYCGVLGSGNGCVVPCLVMNRQMKVLESKQLSGYCELGNHLMRSVFSEFNIKNNEKYLITQSEQFYPVYDSGQVGRIFRGEITLPASSENYALHWFGGHPKSQEFNTKYNPEFALKSNDTISVYCRKIGIL